MWISPILNSAKNLPHKNKAHYSIRHGFHFLGMTKPGIEPLDVTDREWMLNLSTSVTVFKSNVTLTVIDKVYLIANFVFSS